MVCRSRNNQAEIRSLCSLVNRLLTAKTRKCFARDENCLGATLAGIGTRHAMLREATKLQHRSLDERIGVFNNKAEYRRYLAMMTGFRCAVEEALPDKLGAHEKLSLKSALLADCRDLGMDWRRQTFAFALGEAREDFFGAAYVIEGAALGAKILSLRAQSLGFGADFGASHLALQTADSGRWNRFLRLLERESELCGERVKRAAKDTFAFALYVFESIDHAATR